MKVTKIYLGPKGIIRTLTFPLLVGAMVASTGCGGNRAAKQQDNFFTSGSREADQRATQRMARDEQLAGTGEGAGERGARKESGQGASTNEAKQTLYTRLGGEQTLSALVDDFVERAIQDPRVNWERKGLKSGGFSLKKDKGDEAVWAANGQNLATLKKHLVQFFALATGGPSQYGGKEMKSAHAGLKITNPEFDAAIGDLKASLDKLQIPNKEQKELLAIVESTRPQIVTER